MPRILNGRGEIFGPTLYLRGRVTGTDGDDMGIAWSGLPSRTRLGHSDETNKALSEIQQHMPSAKDQV